MEHLSFWMALVAGVVLAFGCHREVPASSENDSQEPRTSKQVRCGPVQSREVQGTIEIHGTIAPLPDRDAQVAAQVPGRILQVLVREGDRVQQSQALARIDDAGLRDQAVQATAQLAKARAETTLANNTRARTQRVFDRGIAARQELDEAVARVATAEANEAESKASAQIANRQRDRAVVRSPLGGVVMRVFRRPGELVDGTGATPIVEVGDPSRLEMLGTATAVDLVQCRVGAAATISVPAVPTLHLTGIVAAVSPAIDRATGLGVVRVSLKLTGGLSPPVGIAAVARVEVGSKHRATVVPPQALRAAIGLRAEVVVCGHDRHAHVLSVVRGLATDTFTEVTGEPVDAGATPLSPGTMVAIEPVLGIADGDSLEIR